MSPRLSRLLKPSGVEERLGLLLLAFALVVALAHAVLAGETRAGSLVIDTPWARATPAGASVGGGFLTIRNTGGEADRLVGGEAPFSERFEIHQMAMDAGVMKMRPLAEGLEIPAGGEVRLEPGGYHVMFVGLKEPLVAGKTVTATLVFEKAGRVTVEWPVAPIGAKAPSEDHGAHQGHGG
ncbi:copper chaperone PCu(A)C [Chthonobacter rhizosphaerae]|uniref:copper chaperone PCu(A)C n=1 Tax=Chthonobacter rhizosphaerae TaxID=2735553 RepID=UPI0015EFCD8F|nr:copper chaperone PCu(A)C [Chthonobacter rhizosphaerae]